MTYRNGRVFEAARVLVLTLGPLLLLTSYATADDSTATNVPKGLYGAWYFPSFERSWGTMLISLGIEQSRITSTARCSHLGGSVEVRVASPAQITANQITVLEARREERGRFPSCTVRLIRGTFGYRLQEGRLLLINRDSGETAELTRKAL